MPKLGQRIAENPKDHTMKIRFADTDMEMLEALAVDGKTKSAVIREGIRIQYEQQQRKRK